MRCLEVNLFRSDIRVDAQIRTRLEDFQQRPHPNGATAGVPAYGVLDAFD